MYCATWGTSSTMSRRVWSLGGIAPRRYHEGPGAGPDPEVPVPGWPRPGAASGADGDEDRALAARPERPEVVVAGEHLDDEPGVLGERRAARRPPTRRSGRGGPSGRRLALAALLEDRGQGRRSRVAASCCAEPALVTIAPVSGIEPRPLEDDPAVEAGEVVGVGQPDVDDGEAARARGGRRAPRAPRAGAARVGRTSSELRARNARPKRPASGRRRPTRSRLDELEPAGRRPACAAARRRARSSIAGSRSTPVTGGRPRRAGRRAGRCRRPARGSGRRSARRARGRGRGRPGRRSGRGRRGGRARRAVAAIGPVERRGRRSVTPAPSGRVPPSARLTASALIASRAARLAAIAVVSAWSYGGETSTMSMPGEVDRADDLADRPQDLAGEHPARLRRAGPGRHARVDDVDVERQVDRVRAVERLGDRVGDDRLGAALLDLAHEVPAQALLLHPLERLDAAASSRAARPGRSSGRSTAPDSMSRRIGVPWPARTPQSSFAVSAWASKWTMPMLPGPADLGDRGRRSAR